MNSNLSAFEQHRRPQDVHFSKYLSYILRHGAEERGIVLKDDGFVRVDELWYPKRLQRLRGYNFDDIKRVVANDEKQRFSLVQRKGFWEIRANQGHSLFHVTELNLRIVVNPNFPIIHGTYFRLWSTIKSQGLSRMTRNYIHFAKGLNDHRGLRKNAQVYIYIDFHKAKSGGLEFWESTNGVILCKGNDQGLIKTQYFKKVTTTKDEILFP